MRRLKLGLLTLASVAGMVWLAVIVWLIVGFVGWCLRPAQGGWNYAAQVAAWSVLAWWTVLFIIINER